MVKKFSTFRAQELSDVPGKPKNKKHWGYHLLVDMSHCNKNIDDEKVVSVFIKKLIEQLDMKAIGDTIFARVDDEEGRGLSAVQLITTSSITFHGDDQEWCAYVDIFSCKQYDPKKVLKIIDAFFSPEHVGYKWIYRDAGRWPE